MDNPNVKFIGLNKNEIKCAKEYLAGLPLDNNGEYAVLKGFCDVHVHFREPGFAYKETVKSGSLAAARGGYTAVCAMPNLNPVPDCVESLQLENEIINRDAVIRVYPYGAITVGEKGKELSDLEGMAEDCIAFSDDGKGVQNDGLMVDAMLRAKALGKIIVAHCEDEKLLCGGCIHDGEYARQNGFIGISSASEYAMVERDLGLVEKTGCAYHVCHVSTKESVEFLRRAKAKGLDVTAETAPHYLTFNDSDLKDEGKWKMNPPIRSEEDRLALLAGIQDGTIDMIATDHAPHSAEEKSKGLKGSLFGVVGLETAFPILYTKLVKDGEITLEKLVELLSGNPRARFGICDDGFSVWKLDEEYEINPDDFLSQGKATPYDKERVFGKCLCTVLDGKAVYQD